MSHNSTDFKPRPPSDTPCNSLPHSPVVGFTSHSIPSSGVVTPIPMILEGQPYNEQYGFHVKGSDYSPPGAESSDSSHYNGLQHTMSGSFINNATSESSIDRMHQTTTGRFSNIARPNAKNQQADIYSYSGKPELSPNASVVDLTKSLRDTSVIERKNNGLKAVSNNDHPALTTELFPQGGAGRYSDSSNATTPNSRFTGQYPRLSPAFEATYTVSPKSVLDKATAYKPPKLTVPVDDNIEALPLIASLPKQKQSDDHAFDHSTGLTHSPGTIRRKNRATTFDIPGLTKSKVSPDGTVSSVDLGSKLVVVMVGLPARGKSFITNKLCRYLTWQQHRCKIFNVGNTRRNANTKGNEVDDLNPTPSEKQDASFFSPSNAKSKALRELWAMDTLDKLLDYILLDNGTVGILDATNTTIMRRRKVLDTIAERTGGQLKVLFLESICTKPEIINQNIRLKLSGPDYKNIDPEIAIKDFINRLKNYEQAYETLDDEKEIDLQYCKIIDVGARTITNNIKGFLACQVVFFMLNFNLTERQIWICRHGESEDNVLGRIGGDSGITERGKKFSRTLARFMEYQKSLFRKKQLEHFASHNQILSKKSEKNQQGGSDDKSLPMTPMNEPEDPNFCVWSSMLRRSVETAEYFSEEKFDIKEMRMLNELSAGKCEGMTYAEIRDEYPSEYESRMAQKILYRYPGIGGESYLDVIARLRPVIVEIERMEDHLCIIAHRIVCRVLLAYFMNLGRDSIGELDVPLHTLYVLEPKPYGVDWAMYEYSEKADWFFQVPKENIPRRATALRSKVKASKPSLKNATDEIANPDIDEKAPSKEALKPVPQGLAGNLRKADLANNYKQRKYSVIPSVFDKKSITGYDDIVDLPATVENIRHDGFEVNDNIKVDGESNHK